MKCKDVKVTKRFPELGFEIRIGKWEHHGKVCYTKQAYNREGDWIGDPRWAYRLAKKWGIYPQKRKPEHDICSIGFSERKQRWYGWSQRAIKGFGIGSTCKKGDCHYIPADWKEIRDEGYFGKPCHFLEEGRCRARTTTDSKVRECSPKNCVFRTGRGEWTAKTLDDAKQMAMDFAEGVS